MAGFRSALAPWVGGAGVPPPPPIVPGFRSMLAPWVGGAGAHIEAAPPPAPGPGFGSGGVSTSTLRVPPDLREALRARIIEEDDVLLLLLAARLAKRLQ